LNPEAPIVGTGLEKQVAMDSRTLLRSEGSGVVEYVDAEKITINYKFSETETLTSFESNIKTYLLPKFRRTNQNSCVNMKPIVVKDKKWKKEMSLLKVMQPGKESWHWEEI
jgi:DNA-directed RNA polymerase subunit beta